jgi:competence protein ComEC
MPIICLSSFVLATLLAHLLPAPGAWLGVPAAGVGLWLSQAAWRRYAWCGLAGLLGLCWGGWSIERYLAQRVSLAEVGTRVEVVGQVHGLTRPAEGSQQFLFRISDPAAGAPRLLEVSWYEPPQSLRAGERWALTLRLDAAIAARNPGGFDRERWWAGQRVHGLARVVDAEQARRLGPPQGLHAWRDRLAERVSTAIADPAAAAMAAALLVGDRRGLGAEQWQRLIGTGTNHLVAISGLHVGLAAGIGWLLFAGLWRWLSPWRERVPARIAGAAPALAIAAGYALLAGFSLPTQRALLMLGVAVVIVCARRRAAPVHALLLAAALVLLVDPLAPLQAGFWLSFLAVGMLLAVAEGWYGVRQHPARLWLRAQLALFIGLAPLTVAAFGQVSLISPLANALAVPVVSAYVVPLLLASLPLMPVSDPAADFVLGWAGWLLQWLDLLLRWLHGLGGYRQGLVTPPLTLAAVLCAAVLCWLRGLGRWVLVPMLVPALLLGGWSLWRGQVPPPGAFEVVVLDAGYGHASLLRTATARVLIDIGPAGFARERDAALAATGAGGLDVLLITRDRAGNHGGGRDWPAAARRYGHHGEAGCAAADGLDRDGVSIRVVGLGAGGATGRCAVVVAGSNGLVVFATGIERRDEWRQVQNALPEGDGARPVDLLVLPGHGDAALLPPASLRHAAAVAPADARRRYQRPQPATLEHYRQAGVPLWVTGCSGALHWRGGRPRALRSGPGWWVGPRLTGAYLRAAGSGTGAAVSCPNPL